MKTTRLLLLPPVFFLAVVLGLQAQEKKSAKSEVTTTQLEDTMDEINAAYRKLNRQIGDSSKNADSLKQVAAIQKHAAAAMKMEPMKKKTLPAAEQAKFMADYQAKMKSFMADVTKLETALKAGKNDEAAGVLKTFKQTQEESHKQFKKDKKEKAKAEPEKK
jgi:soluble cytochrome b562